MRILADENMPLVEAFFSSIGEVQRVPGRAMTAAQVRDVDILLVRSVTTVNQALLDQSRVRFVGTATIGTDHIDRAWLGEQGIAFSSAPGCNAEAVADYVLASLLHLAEREGVALQARTVGVVGVGNVGGRVASRLQALGVPCLLNDPPRAARGEGGGVALERVLVEADVLCLHTPLVCDGPWPTRHLLNEARLAALRPGTWLLNAGRGAVVDNQALKRRLAQRPDLAVVLDVWEPEPGLDPELAAQVDLATPHIAGYSLEGKLRGTEMLYRALCAHLGRPVEHSLERLMAPPALASVRLDPQAEGQSLLLRLARLCYDPRNDDERLRRTLRAGEAERAQAFDRLRREYPVRREFSSLRVEGGSEALRRQLSACGFTLGQR